MLQLFLLFQILMRLPIMVPSCNSFVSCFDIYLKMHQHCATWKWNKPTEQTVELWLSDSWNQLVYWLWLNKVKKKKMLFHSRLHSFGVKLSKQPSLQSHVLFLGTFSFNVNSFRATETIFMTAMSLFSQMSNIDVSLLMVCWIYCCASAC